MLPITNLKVCVSVYTTLNSFCPCLRGRLGAATAVCHFLQIRLLHCLKTLQILINPLLPTCSKTSILFNITEGRMYSMFLCLPPSCLPNTNTITSVAAEKTRVLHSAGEIIFWWGPNSLSGSQRLFIVCWCRVVGVCSSPCVIHCYDSLFYELFSHCLSSSTQTETIQ